MEILLLLILIVLAVLTNLVYQYLKKQHKLSYYRDTLHPVYSVGELNEARQRLHDTWEDYQKFDDQNDEQVGLVIDKIKKNKKYKPTNQEESLLEEDIKLRLEYERKAEVHNAMVETNVRVFNGNIKLHLEEADQVNASPFVGRDDVDKEYNAWISRVRK